MEAIKLIDFVPIEELIEREDKVEYCLSKLEELLDVLIKYKI